MPDASPEAGNALTNLQNSGRSIDPHLRPFFEAWLDTFVYNGRLDAQVRHLGVLRIMWRTGQAFEWGNHYRFARNAGSSREQILAIRTSTPEALRGEIGTVVRAADELLDIGWISRPTLDTIRDTFKPEQVDELLFLLAGYRMFASVARSKGETHPASHMLWPPDGRGPDDLR